MADNSTARLDAAAAAICERRNAEDWPCNGLDFDAELARVALDAAGLHSLLSELTIRKRQLGLIANCLSHIEASAIAPEPIRIAATAAMVGASELTKEIDNAQS